MKVKFSFKGLLSLFVRFFRFIVLLGTECDKESKVSRFNTQNNKPNNQKEG